MLQALKKLLGLDEEAKAARLKAAEDERREREARIQQQKGALEESVKANRQ